MCHWKRKIFPSCSQRGRSDDGRRLTGTATWLESGGSEMEEATVSRGVQAVPRSWKRQRKGFIARVFWKESSPTNIYFSPVRLMLNCDLRNYKVTRWCCYINHYISGNLLQQQWGTDSFPSGEESACDAGDEGSVPGLGDRLEEEMAMPPNNLAWRMPWTEEPGGYSLQGHKRVGQDSATKQLQSQKDTKSTYRKKMHET